MFLTLVTFALVSFAAAAPLNEDPVYYQHIRRTKNSLDLFNKKCDSSLPILPVALSIQPQASSQYYREHEAPAGQDKQARSLYEVSAPSYGVGASAQIAGLAPAGLSGAGLSGAGLSGAGSPGSSAVGVFPHGQVSPCAKPLLLSCSPSVIAGHILEQHYAAPSYGAPSYREGEDQLNHLHHHHQNHHEGDSEAVEKAAEIKSW